MRKSTDTRPMASSSSPDSIIRCPYCHRSIDLEECRVVRRKSTSAATSSAHASFYDDDGSFDAEDWNEDFDDGAKTVPQPPTPSNRKKNRNVEPDLHVVYDPTNHVVPETSKRGRRSSSSDSHIDLFGSRRRASKDSLLKTRASGDRLATFECMRCSRLLPQDIQTRRSATIAVVGTVGAGKTTFLATALGLATSEQALAPYGIESFKESAESDARFHRDYWSQVFDARQSFHPTHESTLAERLDRPLNFTATIRGTDCRLYFYDLPGESIRSRETRLTSLNFIHRADAIIFLVDPLGFRAIREPLRDSDLTGIDFTDLGYPQSALINAISEEIGPDITARVPVAFVITKSDLVFSAFGPIADILHEPESPADSPVGARSAQIDSIGLTLTETVIPLLGAPDFTLATQSFKNSSFHLIASIGSNPVDNQIDQFSPSRACDPLLSVLHRVDLTG